MLVREIMTKAVKLVDSSTSIRDAAEMMRDQDVGALPVGESGRLTGMITDRDLVIRALAAGKDLELTSVREVMTPRLSFIFDDQDVREAADVMAEHQVRRLPVLDRQKRIVGIISLGDLSRSPQPVDVKAETLRQVSEPAAAHH